MQGALCAGGGAGGGRTENASLETIARIRWEGKRQRAGTCEKRGKWTDSRSILKGGPSGPYDGLTAGAHAQGGVSWDSRGVRAEEQLDDRKFSLKNEL